MTEIGKLAKIHNMLSNETWYDNHQLLTENRMNCHLLWLYTLKNWKKEIYEQGIYKWKPEIWKHLKTYIFKFRYLQVNSRINLLSCGISGTECFLSLFFFLLKNRMKGKSFFAKKLRAGLFQLYFSNLSTFWCKKWL